MVVSNASCSYVTPWLILKGALDDTASRVTFTNTVRCQRALRTALPCRVTSLCNGVSNHAKNPSPVHLMKVPPAARTTVLASQFSRGRNASKASAVLSLFRCLLEPMISQTQTTPRPRLNSKVSEQDTSLLLGRPLARIWGLSLHSRPRFVRDKSAHAAANWARSGDELLSSATVPVVWTASGEE